MSSRAEKLFYCYILFLIIVYVFVNLFELYTYIALASAITCLLIIKLKRRDLRRYITVLSAFAVMYVILFITYILYIETNNNVFLGVVRINALLTTTLLIFILIT